MLVNLFSKLFPSICVDNNLYITGEDYETRRRQSFKTEERKRALSELKSARTLINKALLRLNSNQLECGLFELDQIICDLETKLKNK